jgi:uncharacterized protein
MTNTWLITGASTGIGAIYADRLARRGHDLILIARDKAKLDALAARLSEETGVAVEVLPADLGKAGDLARVEARLRTDPAISGLVNNAGISGGGDIASVDPDRLEALIQLNAIALTRLSAAAAAAFSPRGEGTIVNIGSVTAFMAESFEPVYLATKAYVLAFSQALATQLAPKGVRVQIVLPGITRTPIWDKAGADVDAFPAEMVMNADDMVDAALAGLDLGELVTIPALPDHADFERLEEARLALGPNLSRSRPADRYRVVEALAA